MAQKSDITSKILDRLEEFLSQKGDTLTSLIKELKVSRGYFSTARRLSTEIGSDKLIKILRLYPDMSADWLLTGSGFMLKEARSLTNLAVLLEQDKKMQAAQGELCKIQEHLDSLQKQIGVPITKSTSPRSSGKSPRSTGSLKR
jgi:predicted DNA-binding helix-hairpin-helix protein